MKTKLEENKLEELYSKYPPFAFLHILIYSYWGREMSEYQLYILKKNLM